MICPQRNNGRARRWRAIMPWIGVLVLALGATARSQSGSGQDATAKSAAAGKKDGRTADDFDQQLEEFLGRADSKPIPADSGTDSSTRKSLSTKVGPTSDSHAPGRANALVAAISIFVLAIFVGFEVISKVPATLHTPLMSGSNAISGITIVGALILAGESTGLVSGFLTLAATALAAINVVGGFLVTHRMLGMFRRK